MSPAHLLKFCLSFYIRGSENRQDLSGSRTGTVSNGIRSQIQELLAQQAFSFDNLPLLFTDFQRFLSKYLTQNVCFPERTLSAENVTNRLCTISNNLALFTSHIIPFLVFFYFCSICCINQQNG